MRLNRRRTFLTAICAFVILWILILPSGSSSTETQATTQIEIEETPSPKESYQQYHQVGLGLTYDEYIMVCSLVQGETAGAEIHWSELVAGIVYNRLNSQDFPDTVYEVLSQPNQFDDLKYYDSGITINTVTYQAVYNVFTGNAEQTMKNLDGAVYYCNPDILDEETLSWFDDTLTKTYDATYETNGKTYHHVFYK
jgi:hypothetical protein